MAAEAFDIELVTKRRDEFDPFRSMGAQQMWCIHLLVVADGFWKAASPSSTKELTLFADVRYCKPPVAALDTAHS